MALGALELVGFLVPEIFRAGRLRALPDLFRHTLQADRGDAFFDLAARPHGLEEALGASSC